MKLFITTLLGSKNNPIRPFNCDNDVRQKSQRDDETKSKTMRTMLVLAQNAAAKTIKRQVTIYRYEVMPKQTNVC